MTDWQPMETAPKDDAVIVRSGGDPIVAMFYTGRWVEARYSEVLNDFIPTDDTLRFEPMGWITVQQPAPPTSS